MRTAVLYGKEDIRIEDRPVPEPGPGQMLVKIDYVGICGTDIEFYKLGQTPTPLPKILGHENSGTIVKLGEGVTDFQVGQRVLCGPPAHCKENCSPCKEGKTNICIHGFPRTAGIGMPDGGYAEYLLIEDVAHTMIIPVPENVKMEDAVLFDVICVALHGIRMSRFKLGDSVVVSGMGPAGPLCRSVFKSRWCQQDHRPGCYRQKKRSCSRLWCRLFSEFRHRTGHRRIHP